MLTEPAFVDRILVHQHSTLSYRQLGNGANILIVFHGIGQSKNDFTAFVQSLKETYTIYVFDLYFHGDSYWTNDQKPVMPADWKSIFHNFLDTHNLTKFSLVGLSLGARFALQIVMNFPLLIEQVYLVAPDGIQRSFWYSLATSTQLSRWCFKMLVRKSHHILSLIRLTHRLGLISRKLHVFATYQLKTDKRRWLVYTSWIAFRKLTVSQNKLAKQINTHNLETIFILATNDRVIPYSAIVKFSKKLKYTRVISLPTEHHQLVKGETILPYVSVTKSDTLH